MLSRGFLFVAFDLDCVFSAPNVSRCPLQPLLFHRGSYASALDRGLLSLRPISACPLGVSTLTCSWALNSELTIGFSFPQSIICPINSWCCWVTQVIHLEVILGVPSSLPMSAWSLTPANLCRTFSVFSFS